MTTTTRSHRADPRSRPTAALPTATVGPPTRSFAGLTELTDALRDAGYVVHTRCAKACDHEPRDLVHTAEQFLGRALAPSDAIASGHAYVRVYRSTESLFLEVTQLMPESFRLAARDAAAQTTLDELHHWACAGDHVLSVRPGPRNQLRVAAMIAAERHRPGHIGDEPPIPS
jgi:hypothetical protein